MREKGEEREEGSRKGGKEERREDDYTSRCAKGIIDLSYDSGIENKGGKWGLRAGRGGGQECHNQLVRK